MRVVRVHPPEPAHEHQRLPRLRLEVCPCPHGDRERLRAHYGPLRGGVRDGDVVNLVRGLGAGGWGEREVRRVGSTRLFWFLSGRRVAGRAPPRRASARSPAPPRALRARGGPSPGPVRAARTENRTGRSPPCAPASAGAISSGDPRASSSREGAQGRSPPRRPTRAARGASPHPGGTRCSEPPRPRRRPSWAPGSSRWCCSM